MSVLRYFNRREGVSHNTPAERVSVSYAVGDAIGSGGSAIVQRDPANPDVCTKVVRGDRTPSIAACICEITIGMALSPHPNIMRFLAVEYADGHICIRMPYMRETLRAVMAQSRTRATNAIRGVTAGLAYMHGKGVIHCDIKPENIYVCGDSAVIGDFGSAILVGAPPIYYELQTVTYRAPETAPGRAPTPAIDMWSLGVIIAEIGGYMHSTAARHEDYVRDVTTWARAHSPQLAAGLLSHNPADRGATSVAEHIAPAVTCEDLRERVCVAIRARLRSDVDYSHLAGAPAVALSLIGRIPDMTPSDIKQACRLSCAAAGMLL